MWISRIHQVCAYIWQPDIFLCRCRATSASNYKIRVTVMCSSDRCCRAKAARSSKFTDKAVRGPSLTQEEMSGLLLTELMQLYNLVAALSADIIFVGSIKQASSCNELLHPSHVSRRLLRDKSIGCKQKYRKGGVRWVFSPSLKPHKQPLQRPKKAQVQAFKLGYAIHLRTLAGSGWKSGWACTHHPHYYNYVVEPSKC